MADSPFTGESIPDLLRARVEASPDVEAYWHEADGKWHPTTWRQFSEKVDRLAVGLVSKGLTPGMHVGLLFPTSLEWEVAHHAVLRAGGVVVGLEPHDTGERLRWIIGHADVSVLIVQNRALFDKIVAHGALDLRRVVFVDAEVSQLADGEARLGDLMASDEDAAPLPEVKPDAAATIIYTSGTTGQPKGILYRHEQVVLAIKAITSAYPSIAVGSRFVCWLPLSNLFQRIMNLAAMHVGGTVYLVKNPLDVLKALPVAKPDIFIGVPRFYEKLHEGMMKEIERKPAPLRRLIRKAIELAIEVSRARREGKHVSRGREWLMDLADHVVLSKLRGVMGGRIQFMITGSAPTPMRLLEFFHAIRLPLYEAYGMSENVVPMALNRPGRSRIGTVGIPLTQNELCVADDGELLVRGLGVFGGYYRDARADLFTADGFYRTGDFASIDADGYLSLRGRKSEIIKTSTGRRISPAGIESVLQEASYVDRAAVFGEGRKCLVAMLSVAGIPLEPLEREAIDGLDVGALADADRFPFATQCLIEAITPVAQTLSEHERPIGYVVLCRPFAIETGELTSNLKIRRREIEQRFSNHVNELYDRIDLTRSAGAPVFVFTK